MCAFISLLPGEACLVRVDYEPRSAHGRAVNASDDIVSFKGATSQPAHVRYLNRETGLKNKRHQIKSRPGPRRVCYNFIID